MASAFEMLNKRAVRAPSNPLDKATIVSIFPKSFLEHKVTLQPSTYEIPAGTPENPGILVVGPASWWKFTGEDQPLLEIPHSAVVMAESIVNDTIHALMAVEPGICGPGVFFVPGEKTAEQVKKEHKDQIEKAVARQRLWYSKLVEAADAEWARNNGNPLAIPNDARFAARALGLDKPWTKDFQLAQNIPCIACGNLRNPEYPICPSCKMIVDAALATKLGIKPSA